MREEESNKHQAEKPNLANIKTLSNKTDLWKYGVQRSENYVNAVCDRCHSLTKQCLKKQPSNSVNRHPRFTSCWLGIA